LKRARRRIFTLSTQKNSIASHAALDTRPRRRARGDRLRAAPSPIKQTFSRAQRFFGRLRDRALFGGARRARSQSPSPLARSIPRTVFGAGLFDDDALCRDVTRKLAS
jgi:hypothetical protein